jgi:hypothetical protein
VEAVAWSDPRNGFLSSISYVPSPEKDRFSVLLDLPISLG